MDFYWPLDIIPAAQQWSVLDNSSVFSSPLSGTVRTYSRPGTQLACTMEFRYLRNSDRYRVMGLLAALKGRSNRIWLPDISTPIRGSFPAAELLSNTTFATTTGWTSSNAELVLGADSGRLRLTRAGVTANRYAYAQAVTAASAAYLLRAGVLPGRGAMSCALQLGTSTTGAELATSSTLTAGGYQQISAAASGSTTYASLRDNNSGRSTDFFQLFDSPSLARCALVQGAPQIGSGLLVDGLPASTNGLLVAGNMVAVYTTQWEMKRLIADLNSNASGAGYLMFEPSLRASPADNAPVAIFQPCARFLLASDNVSWNVAPGLFSDFSLDFIEDIT